MASVMSTIEIIMGTVRRLHHQVGRRECAVRPLLVQVGAKKKPEPTVEPWQWVEKDDDFLIEATLEPFEGRGGR